MDALRTPEDRFANLPAFGYQPHYVGVPDGDGGRLRMAYLDEGPREAPVVLLMHGEPSWNFLYRKMIDPIAAAGFRVLAPDLVGFGRSDKPARAADYSYARHVAWTSAALFGELDLAGVTLFGQDWGGLIGLRLVGEHPERFARVVAANTFLPTGDRDPGEAFRAWQRYAREAPTLRIGSIVRGGCARPVADEVVAAYDAPFPDESYKAGARSFPTLVPTTPDDPAAPANRRAWEVLRRFDRPFLTLFGDSDPITGGAEKLLVDLVPGAAGQPHAVLARAGHFLQEDAGEELAEHLLRWLPRPA